MITEIDIITYCQSVLGKDSVISTPLYESIKQFANHYNKIPRVVDANMKHEKKFPVVWGVFGTGKVAKRVWLITNELNRVPGQYYTFAELKDFLFKQTREVITHAMMITISRRLTKHGYMVKNSGPNIWHDYKVKSK